MKVIRLGIMFSGFKFINLFGIIFANKNARISKCDLNHEAIHTAQMKELLYIPFYLLYFIEWIIRLFMEGEAYKNISFEKEAGEYEKDYNYLNNRKHYSFFRFL